MLHDIFLHVLYCDIHIKIVVIIALNIFFVTITAAYRVHNSDIVNNVKRAWPFLHSRAAQTQTAFASAE